MPGVVSRTSTYALTNLTLNYAVKIAQLGLEEALIQDQYLQKGLNTYGGHVCYEPVAQDLGYEYVPFTELKA
jgi:alanine dehydrogenase